MDEIVDRLTAWRPSMREYHSGPEISSGFLRDYRQLGLSEALHHKCQPYTSPTTKTELACGTTLHIWLQEDGARWSPVGDWKGKAPSALLRETLKPKGIAVAPPYVEAKRGGPWRQALAEASRAEVILLHKDFERCQAAFKSLLRGDTGRKQEILAMYQRWNRWAEVSWKWEPEDLGLDCRIRQDLVCQTPSGQWIAPGIKTTTKPVNERAWWPFWRRYYREAEALYRQGLLNLFDGTPFRQALIVARLEPPYKWSWWDLSERTAELEEIWYNELLPDLREIKESMDRGLWYGPEERKLIT